MIWMIKKLLRIASNSDVLFHKKIKSLSLKCERFIPDQNAEKKYCKSKVSPPFGEYLIF